MLIVIGMFWGAGVFADTITFDAPTEREDNTPLAPSEIQGFNVYDVGNGGSLVTTLPGTAREYTTPATTVDQSFAITTVDTDGRESVFSQIAIIPKLVTPPKAPTITGVSR